MLSTQVCCSLTFFLLSGWVHSTHFFGHLLLHMWHTHACTILIFLNQLCNLHWYMQSLFHLFLHFSPYPVMCKPAAPSPVSHLHSFKSFPCMLCCFPYSCTVNLVYPILQNVYLGNSISLDCSSSNPISLSYIAAVFKRLWLVAHPVLTCGKLRHIHTEGSNRACQYVDCSQTLAEHT